MNWRARRKLFIISIILVVVIVFLGILLRPLFVKSPTCSDGMKNGKETGIDCGGLCKAFCPQDLAAPVVLWVRPFQVTDTVASAMAYIENRNARALGYPVKYEFRLFDKDNSFIARRSGTTYLLANTPTAIFEGGIPVGNRAPLFATISFTEAPVWHRVSDTLARPGLAVRDAQIKTPLTTPELDATIENTSDTEVYTNVIVPGILYDEDGNAVAVSETYIESIAPHQKEPISFTWPKALMTDHLRAEILPRVLVDAVFK